jgi:hypothetical protein
MPDCCRTLDVLLHDSVAESNSATKTQTLIRFWLTDFSVDNPISSDRILIRNTLPDGKIARTIVPMELLPGSKTIGK